MSAKSGFLSPRSAAFEGDVDRETVYRWIKSGALPAARIGRQWRIRRTDFEALLTGRAG